MAKRPTSQNAPSPQSARARESLFRLFRERPMGDEELLTNLGLFMRSGALAKVLLLDEVYRRILPIPGAIFELGVWLGQSLVVFENLRAIHEPYNHARHIVGFDTFSGYTPLGAHDVASEIVREGAYSVSEGYERYLAELLDYHEQENVMAHVKKHAVIRGDAGETCPRFLEEHPETLVALAYFDMALYEPTKLCLDAILPRLVKGSVLVLDEMAHADYPGETRAVLETFDLKRVSVERSRYLPDRTILTIT